MSKEICHFRGCFSSMKEGSLRRKLTHGEDRAERVRERESVP